MKKIYFIGASLYMILLTAPFAIMAQGNLKFAIDWIASNHPAPPHYEINQKAMRNFNKWHKGVTNTQWTDLGRRGNVCRFVIDGVTGRAYYNQRGNWLYTVSTYEGDKLPSDVREIVKGTYFDDAISCVNEVNSPMKSAVYMIEIQNQKEIKFLRVIDGEMETVNVLKKL